MDKQPNGGWHREGEEIESRSSIKEELLSVHWCEDPKWFQDAARKQINYICDNFPQKFWVSELAKALMHMAWITDRKENRLRWLYDNYKTETNMAGFKNVFWCYNFELAEQDLWKRETHLSREEYKNLKKRKKYTEEKLEAEAGEV